MAREGVPELLCGVRGVMGVVEMEGATAVAGVNGVSGGKGGGSAARTNTLLNSCALAARVLAASAISATALAHGNCCAAVFVLATVVASASDKASEHRSARDLRPTCWALLENNSNTGFNKNRT